MQSRLTRFLRYALLVVLASAAVTLCVHLLEGARQTDAPYVPVYSYNEPETSVYGLSLALDTQNHRLIGEEKISYLNASGVSLSEIVFCLYPNAYTAKAPMDEKRYYPEGFSPGSIEILSAKEGERQIAPRYSGENREFVSLPLLRPLENGKRAELTINFRTVIPRNRLRFGYDALGYNVTGAYPVAAVYDGEWHMHPYAPFGDPFFHEAAQYRVTLKLPEQYAVASTGTVLSDSVSEGLRTLMIEADGAREFAFCAGTGYKTYRSVVDGVEVEVYDDSSAGEGPSKNALKIAIDAVGIFSERFGKYPFKRLCVVQSDLLDGGMEYPGLVLIDKTLFESGMEMVFEHIIVHETAHQWWYALVGNDQFESPWIDEALAEYSTAVYYEERYGRERGRALYKYFDVNAYKDYKKGLPIDGRLDQYADELEYSAYVYARGAMLYDAVREKMGDEAFFAALKKYASDNAFKIVKKEDILNAFGAARDVFKEYGLE